MAAIQFKGKSAVWNHHLSVPYHTLNKDEKLSLKGADANENLIIEGDNLLALKSLLPKYQGKIKCIYIDPPYNTGEEGWIYNDKVNSPIIKEWIGDVVGKQGEDLTRHDKWLSMMTPRLKLLRELLSQDGILAVSIDDEELGRLQCLLDEIFGENNKEEVIAWRRRHNQPNDKSKPIAKVAEFLVVYAKDLEYLKAKGSFFGLSLTGRFSNPDNDPCGDWASKPWKAGEGQTGTRYKITTPTGKVFEEEWLGTEVTYQNLLREGRIYFPKNGDGFPRKKYYKNERETEGQVPHNFWGHEEFGSNQEATEELKALSIPFDNPKPIKLLKAIIKIFTEKDSIVLDSYTGSGTTAHAVMDLNHDDTGNRKYILVQLPEKIDGKQPAYNAGFRWVHEITRERVRRVIENNKYKTGFTYYRLGQTIDAESLLSGKLPTYEEFAKYVFYLATGENHPDEKKIKEKDFFVGKTDHTTVYLLYERDFAALNKLAITLDWAQQTHKKDAGKKIVYAPACYLDEESLEKYNIQFVSIPYNLFERIE